jgi:phosphoglycerol transferase MdoB-like AlkP superfamily enzyme
MDHPQGAQQRRATAWLTPGLCAAFGVALLAQELVLLLQIAPHDQPLATWRWRLLFPMTAVSVALLLPFRVRWSFLGTIGAVVSLGLLADAAYFSFFGSLTSLRSAVSLHQLWDVRDSVLELIQPPGVLVALLFAALAIAGPLIPDPRVRRSRECAAGLVLAVLTGATALVAWRTPIYERTHHIGRNPWQLPAQHWGSHYSPVRFAVAFGPVNYHARDLAQWWRSRHSRPAPLSAEREAELRAWLEHKHALNATASPLFGLGRGRHVVIVQLESWQHLLTERAVDGVEITPRFNQLAQESLVFDCIMDVTHHGRTSDAEFALHTGLLPDIRKPAAFHHVGSVAISLPRALRELGYRTMSFHAYDRAFWNRAYTHPDWGIDEMYFREVFSKEEQIGLGAADHAVYRLVARKLAERDRQLSLAFVISLSSHHPYIYTPREYADFFARLTPGQGYGLIGGYLRSARFADDALGAFIDEMIRLGLHQRTLYVIYGDHDMGGVGVTRPVPELGPDAFTLTGDRVPLLIAVPGEEQRIAAVRERYRTTLAGLHDVGPTLLHLLGETPPLGMEGTHLFVPPELRDPLPLPPEGAYAKDGVIYWPPAAFLLSPSARARFDAAAADSARRERELVQELLDHRVQARVVGSGDSATRVARGG